MIVAGHPDPLRYTPRQIFAYRFLAEKRKGREAAFELSLHASASRGEPRSVKEQIRKWLAG